MFQSLKISNSSKKILSNFLSLMSLQGLNYILPLVLMPFLLNKLGFNNFGLLTYVTTIFIIYGFLLDYGFNLSASREISSKSDEYHEISQIFYTVYFIKIIIIIICLILLLIASYVVPLVIDNRALFFYSFFSITVQYLLPTFFLIGIERMVALSRINMLMKFASAILLFIFIDSPDDIHLVPMIYMFGGIIALIYSYYFLHANHLITKEVKLTKSIIRRSLQQGFPIFIAILSSNIIYYSPILMLGYLNSKVAVGIYTVADTIMRAIRNIIYPAASAILPHSTRMAITDIKKSLLFNLKISILFMVLLTIICLFFYMFSRETVDIFLTKDKENLEMISYYLNILLLTVPLHALTHLFCTQSILNLNLTKSYSIIFGIISFISLISSYILVEKFNILGAAISYSLMEIILCFSFIAYIVYYAKSRKII